MLCPACKTVNLTMAERSGVEIDYCPQCRGVWLDRGELDKIIDRGAAQSSHPSAPPPYQPPPYQQPPQHQPQGHYQGGYYKKKKREGFLSDIFDFD
jgi:Zn-finger nucleic acid-binding protein